MSEEIVKSLISVIMPVFNEKPDYLKAAINSILNQSYENFEFIIIDDGSTTKDITEIIETFAKSDNRIIHVKNKVNLGITATLNKALSLAHGQYIARMDSDDVSVSTRLDEQLKFLMKNPDILLCGTWADLIDENNNIIGHKKPYTEYNKIKKFIFSGNFFIHPSWLFKKELINIIGNYSDLYPRAEDYEFLLRAISKHKVANVPQFLLKYRINPRGISFSKIKQQERQSILLRFKKINELSYSYYNYIFILKSIILYFIPISIKKILFKLLWKI